MPRIPRDYRFSALSGVAPGNKYRGCLTDSRRGGPSVRRPAPRSVSEPLRPAGSARDSPPPARGQFRQWNSLGSLVPSAADRSRSRRARPIRLAEPQRQKSEAAIQRTAYHDQYEHDDNRQNLEQPRVRGRAVRVEGALAPPFSHVVRPRRLPAGPCTTRPEIINPGRGFRQRKHRLRVRRYPARHRIQ